MKDSNLLTPDLHDFSDLKISMPKSVAVVGIIVTCLALLYGALEPFRSTETAEAAVGVAPPALTKS